MIAVILFLSLFFFMIIQVPVGLAIGCASIMASLAGAKISFPTITKMLIVGCDNFPIMAIPFFVLAGDLMSAGGISKRLLGFFDALLGRLYGGTAIVTVAVAMFFAAVSGSGPATAPGCWKADCTCLKDGATCSDSFPPIPPTPSDWPSAQSWLSATTKAFPTADIPRRS